MRLMKAVLVLAAVCLALPVVAQTSNAALERELLAMLHPMHEAERRHDLAYVRAHLAADFAEVAGDGNVYGVEAIEKGFADMELKQYKLTDCLAKPLDHDVAYLTCRMEVDAAYKGTPLPRQMRVTWLWKKGETGWVVSFEQATLLPPS